MLETKSEFPKENEMKKSVPKKSKKAAENFSSELEKPIWSVVSFEKILENNLTYHEAARKIAEFSEQKISGLCIITDQAARNIRE